MCRINCVVYVIQYDISSDFVRDLKWFTDMCSIRLLHNQIDDCTKTRWGCQD
jgi:hypothetical protein